MIRCAVITDIAVWSYGAGHISRLRALIDFLTKYSLVTIIYIGRKPVEHIPPLLPPRVNIVFLEHEHKADEERNIVLVNKLLSFEAYKVCFVEYIHLSYFLRAIPDHVISVLDAHDIISERNKSFNSLRYDNWDYEMPAEREFKLYRLYDKVMLISKNDFDISARKIGKRNLILGPHPMKVKRKLISGKPKVIGFVASDYLPNVDAICWFLKEVWPAIPKSLGLELHLYGLICRKVPLNNGIENVFLKGFASDLDIMYSQIDIAINPVRMGSGMKIKNIEALAYGIPLVTTHHGSSGIEQGIGNSFLTAQTGEQFAESVIRLALDNEMYQRFSDNALILVERQFSDEKCFGQIKKILLKK